MAAAAHSAKARDLGPQANIQERRILVVDDSEPVRDVIRTFLERTGYQICGEAADGLDAIEKAKDLKPSLIVLDLSMPGMNGAEAASTLMQLMPEVPIVVLTMYGDVLGQAMASDLGVKAVVAKAGGMTKLVECVQRLLPPNPGTATGPETAA